MAANTAEVSSSAKKVVRSVYDSEAERAGDESEVEILTPDTHPEARQIEREYFKILHKQNVIYDPKKRQYHLRYFPSDTPAVSRHVPLRQVRTDHSENDDHLKYPFMCYCVFVFAISCTCLFGADVLQIAMRLFNFGNSCDSQPGFFSVGCVQLTGPALFILLGLFILPTTFAFLAKMIENNFVAIDAQWQNSIDQFFAPDVCSKMMGVRLCMLKFRQFIKWRRSSNIFIWCFSITAAIAWLVVVAIAAIVGALQLFEFLASALFLSWLIYVLTWFRAQRRKHTKWRDPTVQLCVMIAELHQRLIERNSTIMEGN